MSFFLKQIYSNRETQITKRDLLEVSSTRDGTFVLEMFDDACELSFDELCALNKAISDEIARTKSKLKL